MILIWRGKGIFIVPFAIAAFFIIFVAVMVTTSFFITNVKWQLFPTLLLTAAAIWKRGSNLNDKDDNLHTFFFIPVQWFCIPFILLAIIVLVSPSDGGSSRYGPDQDDIKATNAALEERKKRLVLKKQKDDLSESSEKGSDFVDPELVERFNQATELGKAGKFKESIDAYDSVFKPLANGKTGVYSQEFYFTTKLQKAFSQMDAGEYVEAEKTMTNADLTRILPDMSPEANHSYYFALGNIYGEQGKFVEMEKALQTDLSHLPKDDKDKRTLVYTRIMGYLKTQKDWKKLLTYCKHTSKLGKESEDFILQLRTMEFAAHGFLGIGEKEKAIRQASKVIDFYKSGGMEKETKAWEEFIEKNK